MQKQLRSLYRQRHIGQRHKIWNLVKTVHHKKKDIKVTYIVQSFHGSDSSDGSDAQQIREALFLGIQVAGMLIHFKQCKNTMLTVWSFKVYKNQIKDTNPIFHQMKLKMFLHGSFGQM